MWRPSGRRRRTFAAASARPAPPATELKGYVFSLPPQPQRHQAPKARQAGGGASKARKSSSQPFKRSRAFWRCAGVVLL
jgi:hypothetical protein